MNHQFRPTASLAALEKRSSIVNTVREYFATRGFLEVDTPLLSSDVVIDRNLDPISVNISPKTGRISDSSRMWLQTSPEFCMKRLLAAGATKIFQICKSFRAEELGDRHNPEFTILEWYQVEQAYAEGRQFLSEFVAEVLATRSAKQITYRDAFHSATQLDPFTASNDQLKALAEDSENVPPAIDLDQRDRWLEWNFSQFVETSFPDDHPVIVYDWPASQAALATIRHEEHPVAERFEIFFNGVELANGYHELLDRNELQQRNQAVNLQRVFDGKSSLPSESRLLDAMQAGMPQCCGCALGIDRLVMLATNANDISQVIPFPFGIA